MDFDAIFNVGGRPFRYLAISDIVFVINTRTTIIMQGDGNRELHETRIFKYRDDNIDSTRQRFFISKEHGRKVFLNNNYSVLFEYLSMMGVYYSSRSYDFVKVCNNKPYSIIFMSHIDFANVENMNVY